MPQRFLRPGITTSKRWNRCDYFSQTFYMRVLTLVDDYGRYDADPELLRSHAFPFGDPEGNPVHLQTIVSGLQTLVNKELILIYQIDGKEYLQLLRWKENARSNSKYPEPPKKDVCKQLQTIDNKCLSPSSSSSPSPSSSPAYVRTQLQADGEAALPTWAEVKTEAEMRSVPEASAKSFFDHHQNNSLWVNQFGRLIDWRRKLISWANNDRSNPQANGINKQNRFERPDRNKGTANEGKASEYDLSKIRKEGSV
jgi:hypothetical protein